MRIELHNKNELVPSLNRSRLHAILVTLFALLVIACAELTSVPGLAPERSTPAASPAGTDPATPVPAFTPSPTPAPTSPAKPSATAPREPTATPTAMPQAVYTPGDHVETIESVGQARRYRLHVPPGYDPGVPAPLVINLHGLASSPLEQAILSGMSDKADEAGFLVVYPHGSDVPRMWHAEPSAAGRDDVQFIRDLVAHLQGELRIDPDRIYATGMSNGGGMAHRLGCDLSDVVAAIAPVAGAYVLDATCTPGRPVPVVAFHGTADRIVPYDGQGRSLPAVPAWARRWAARNGCDDEPATILEQGDVTGQAWQRCDAGADVVLYSVRGGRHNWPGTPITALGAATQDVDATDIIWAFFEAHPMP